MATPKMTRPEVIAAFTGYLADVFGQDLTEPQRQLKLNDILGRFWDTAVRISVNTLTPEDIDLAKWSNTELAEALRTHTFRQGGIRNGIFDKILEAADRLSPEDSRQPVT